MEKFLGFRLRGRRGGVGLKQEVNGVRALCGQCSKSTIADRTVVSRTQKKTDCGIAARLKSFELARNRFKNKLSTRQQHSSNRATAK